MLINELKLAKELIRKPSVTPKDAGAINVLAKNLRSLGFKCQLINFKNIKNLYAKLGETSPIISATQVIRTLYLQEILVTGLLILLRQLLRITN